MDKETFMKQWCVSGMPLDKIKLANAAWDAATSTEREACACLCEEEYMTEDGFGLTTADRACADAIRKRPNYK